MNLAKREITRRLGVSVETAELMMQAGITSSGDIADLTDEALRELTGFGSTKIKALRRKTVWEDVEVKLDDS